MFKVRDAKKALAGACRRLGYRRLVSARFAGCLLPVRSSKGVDVKVIASGKATEMGETHSRYL